MNDILSKSIGFQGKNMDKVSLSKWAKEMKEKENAALAMCGGLLGNCYLLAEITENLMINMMARFKKEKWYRFDIKHYFKASYKELHSSISRSIIGSPTNPDYMREMADSMYDILKPDLFKLRNALSIELYKYNIPYTESCIDIVLIDILLRYIGMEYDDTLRYMKTIFDAYYDSWYHGAKCEGAAFWWNEGLKQFSDKYVLEEVNLNSIPTIQNGISILQKRMHDNSVTDRAISEASKYADAGESRGLFEKALAVLGKAAENISNNE